MSGLAVVGVLLVIIVVLLATLAWLACRVGRRGGMRSAAGGAKAEIEKGYFNFDEADVRSRLSDAGAEHVGLKLLRATQYKPPSADIKIVRIRDDGGRR